MNIVFLFFVNSLLYFFLEDSEYTYDRYLSMKMRFEALDSYSVDIGSDEKLFSYDILYQRLDNPARQFNIGAGHKIYLTPRTFLDIETQFEFPRTQYVVAYDQYGDGLLNPSFIRWFFSEDETIKAKLGYRLGNQRQMVSGNQILNEDGFFSGIKQGFGSLIIEPYVFYALGSMWYEDSSSYSELKLTKALHQFGFGLETYMENRDYAFVFEYSTYNFEFEGMRALSYANDFNVSKLYFGFKYNLRSLSDKTKQARLAQYTNIKYNDTVSPRYRHDGLDQIREALEEKEREELKKKREKYIY